MFRPATEENFHQTAIMILPERIRTFKNAQALLKSAAALTQMQLDERLYPAIKFASDGKSVLVNAANGILRITADEVKLSGHTATERFTGKLAAKWAGAWRPAMTPLFHKVLGEALPEEGDRLLLQWFAAYMLYPSCRHEVFLVSYGPGGTSKSTLSDAMMEMLGADQRTVLSIAQICAEGQGAYSLPSLQYALVNMGTEMDTVTPDLYAHGARLALPSASGIALTTSASGPV